MIGACITVLLALVPVTMGFSSGAGDQACSTMTPSHYGTNPQSTVSPFRVTVSQNTFSPGNQIQVTISGCNRERFKGFLIQARRAEATADRETQIGTFNLSEGSRFLSGCGSNRQAVTHSSVASKESMTFTWTAPAVSPGPIVFAATVVQQFSTYWVKLYSEVIRETNAPPTVNVGEMVYPTKSECSPTTTTTTMPSMTTKTSRFQTRTTPSVPTTTTTMALTGFASDEGCGVTKGCMATCSGMSCSNLVAYSVAENPNEILFELTSAVTNEFNQWMAIGFSDDLVMGNDSVVECVFHNGEFKVYSSFNRAYIKYNERLSDIDGVRLLSASLSEKVFRCSFVRAISSSIGNPRFFNIGKHHHLFFASGPTDIFSDRKKKHMSFPLISGRVNLLSTDSLMWPRLSSGAYSPGIKFLPLLVPLMAML